MRQPITLPYLRRTIALIVSSLLLCLAAACGGDSSTNPNSDAAEGTYSLKSANDALLPFTLQSGTNSLTLTKDC